MPRDAIVGLQMLLDEFVQGKETIRLLEAGCGSMSKVRLAENVSVVGIDISAAQLARNPGLRERILGDIQTFPLPHRSFDIIICWDVLEHLDYPTMAIASFFRAIKPGGLIILAFPNIFSLKGVITKLTPHFVHVWYARRLLGIENAGANDTPPFVTKFKLSVNHRTIRELAKKERSDVAYFVLRESADMLHVRKNFFLVDLLMRMASLLSRAATVGRVDLMCSDCIMVLQGPG